MEDRIPTLGEYAEVISWMASHPGQDIPAHMRDTYNDALFRADLRYLAKLMGAYNG